MLRNKVLMGLAAAGRGQGRAHRRGLPQGLRRSGQDDDAAGGGARPPHPGARTRTRPRRSPSRSRAAPTSPTLAKEKSKDPGARRGRRSRLFHQGSDGAGIRRRRVQDVSGPGLRPGEDASSAGTSSSSKTSARSRSPTFEKVKDQIETFVTRKAQTEYVAKLRQDAKIERLDKPADEPKQATVGENRPGCR